MTRAAVLLYNGALAELLAILVAEAYDDPGRWARRRLPNGTSVAFRIPAARRLGAVRRQLAILRNAAPTTMREKGEWEAEVRRVQLALGVAAYERGDDLFNQGDGVAAVFTLVTSQ